MVNIFRRLLRKPKGEKVPVITYGEIEEVFNQICVSLEKDGLVILDEGGLSHTLYLIGREKHVFDQAGCAMYQIAKNHCFSDKNKTTAITVTEIILNTGGYKLKSPSPEITYKMLLGIASGHKSKKEIKKWVKKHSERI